MKIALLVLAISFSSQSFARITECKQPEQLKCEVQYFVDTGSRVESRTEYNSGKFDLVDWDEPSLAYCEASAGFNKNNIYILGTANASNEVGIAVRHGFDQLDVKYGYGPNRATAFVKFNPKLELPRSEKLVAAAVSCELR